MRYLDVLADQVHPAMLHFYPDGFMDDNTAVHWAKSVQNWIAEHQFDFPLPGHRIAQILRGHEEFGTVVEDDDDNNADSEKELSLEQKF
ncbi:hypothetical protein TNCV_4862511 [Trichonephila clavipes]|nr:hypothetical protein TNCV_4862511 [Trichonephila clavipes]